MTNLVVRSTIHGGGVVRQERIPATCPACGQQVEAVAMNGRVKGYCAVAKQCVDFLVEATPVPVSEHPTDEAKAKTTAALTPGRDSRGRFVKGNVPRNKRV